MAFIVHSPYTVGMAICELVQDYYKGPDRGPLLTRAKKESDARESRKEGYRSGIALAIAEMLTVERSEKFYLWPVTEKVMDWDVSRVLSQQDGKFVGAFPDGDEASSITDFILALIDGDEGQLAARHEEDRRDKVRAGEIDPTAEDLKWLEAELREQMGKTSSVQELIDRARNLDTKPLPAKGRPVGGLL